MTTPPLLPRFDLREPAFRRYEKFLIQAMNKPFVVDPKECFDKPITPTTFIARCKDALLSLRRYGWKSQVDLAKLAKLRMTETINEMVWVDSNRPEERPKEEKEVFLLANHSAIESLLGRLSSREVSGPVEVSGSPEDIAWFQGVSKNYDVEVFEDKKNNVWKVI